MKKLMIIIEILTCIFLMACSKSNPQTCIKGEDLTKKMNEKLATIYYDASTKTIPKDKIQILYYFGRYGNNKDVYVLIVRGSMCSLTEDYYYISAWSLKKENTMTFKFRQIPERIEAVCNDKIYFLNQALDEKILSIEEIEDIYNQFIEIDEVKKFYEKKE